MITLILEKIHCKSFLPVLLKKMNFHLFYWRHCCGVYLITELRFQRLYPFSPFLLLDLDKPLYSSFLFKRVDYICILRSYAYYVNSFLRICIFFCLLTYLNVLSYVYTKGGDIVGIGTKLERLLKERNINVNELAQKINVAPTTLYSMIRRDSKKADIEVLFKLAKELGVDAEYFCDNDEDISRHEPTYDDVERLIARNGKQMSKEQKLRLIQLLSEIVE